VSALAAPALRVGVGVVPSGIAIPATIRAPVLLSAAIRADVGARKDCCITACTRAILDDSMRCPADVERLTAMSAHARATGITYFGSTGTRLEVLPAFSTGDYRIVGRKRGRANVRIVSPEFNLSRAVTRRTKSGEVGKTVSHSVIIKQAVRRLVMNDKRLNRSARLAGVIVAGKRLVALCLPIRPSVLVVAAAPTRIVDARPFTGFAPLGPTLAVAEVAIANCARLFFDRCTTGMAGNRNAVAPAPDVMFLLPFGVTGEPAERVAREGDVIGAPLD
jgi:hypothetical protein